MILPSGVRFFSGSVRFREEARVRERLLALERRYGEGREEEE